MPRQTINVSGSRPLLDLVSFGRKGPGGRDRLSPGEIEHVRRTVERAPEVMVKVLNKGGQDARAAGRHLDYLTRRGDLELETDEGERVAGKLVKKRLIEDWGIDVDDQRRRTGLLPRADSRIPKLVHKLMFSMPPGTPADKVLQAVRNFAAEEFALQHRYAMVLHTDEPHPHVHVVVKAVSEQGDRLNIRKETLRRWRSEFARHLRRLGVPANATERAVRAETRTPKLDGIYRAMLRGESSHVRNRVDEVTDRLFQGTFEHEVGKGKLVSTRKDVVRGWTGVSHLLERTGETALAFRVRSFANAFAPPHTEKEIIAEQLKRQLASQRMESVRREDAR
jgi:hypothetical protein